MMDMDTDLTLSEPGRLSPEFLAAIARSKGRILDKMPEAVEIGSEILPISAGIAVPEEPIVTIPGAPVDYQLGQLIPDKGVYLGVWEPKIDFVSLGKKFNLFAAPYDLGISPQGSGVRTDLSYYATMQEILNIKDYMGHPGRGFEDNLSLCRAIKRNDYNGEWFMPPIGVLYNSMAHAHLGKLAEHEEYKGTFSSDIGKFYWSCSPILEASGEPYRELLQFNPGPLVARYNISDAKDTGITRLVRAELILA